MIPLLGAWAAVKPFKGWILGGVGLIALLGGLWLALDAFGDRRYDQGRADNERAWRAAEEKLQAREHAAASTADKAADVREADHAAEVANERTRINDATRKGDSPLDVLFGPAGGV